MFSGKHWGIGEQARLGLGTGRGRNWVTSSSKGARRQAETGWTRATGQGGQQEQDGGAGGLGTEHRNRCWMENTGRETAQQGAGNQALDLNAAKLSEHKARIKTIWH